MNAIEDKSDEQNHENRAMSHDRKTDKIVSDDASMCKTILPRENSENTENMDKSMSCNKNVKNTELCNKNVEKTILCKENIDKMISDDKSIDKTATCNEDMDHIVLADKNVDSSLRSQSKYCCRTCGKYCTNSSKLKDHERLHTNEKPHVCSLCTKCFRLKSSLVRHVRTHTGKILILLLLNMTCPILANSVDPDQLASSFGF